MQFPINQFKTQGKPDWTKYLVLIIAGYLLIPKYLALQPAIGLEGSWMISINLASLKNAQFGTDYIYTYGPLGFLNTRILLGHSKWLLIISDLFVFSNLIAIFNSYLGLPSSRYRFIKFVAVIFTAVLSQRLPALTALFVILLFHCFKLINNYKQLFSLLAAPVAAAILFFIKLNYGLIAIPLFYLALVAIMLKKGFPSFRYILLPVAINVALVSFLSGYFRVNVVEYVRSGIYIIKDYSDSMMTNVEHSFLPLGAFIIILALYLLVLLAFVWRFKLNMGSYYLPFVVMLAVYLAFKNGFVRFDPLHLTFAYLGMPLLALVPAVTEADKRFKTYYKRLHIVVLAFCFWFWKSSDNIFGNNLNGVLQTTYLREILNTSSGLPVYNLNFPQQEKLNQIKGIVGEQSIDILPHMVMYAYVGGFNYTPRPVPQSFQAYDVFLDTINSIKFSAGNSTSPAYLLFANSTVDKRYPFGDESITKRAILQYYQPIYTFNLTEHMNGCEAEPVILFKRRNFPVKLELINIANKKVKMNEWIETDSSSALQYLYADVDYSLTGRIRRILYQSPRLQMRVRYDDGTEAEYSAIVPILRSGILINKQEKDTYDAYTFFSSNGTDSKKLKAVKFQTSDPEMFQPVIEMALKSFKVNS